MLTAVLCATAAALASTAAPRLSADVVPLASEWAVVDRVPMELHRYHSRLAPGAVLALWADSSAAPAPAPRDLPGGWRVASRLRGALQEILQARPDGAGGSEVILSRVDLLAPPARALPLPFALPAGGALLRTVELADPAGRGHQFIIALPGAPARALAQLCPRLLDRGWHPVGAHGCDGAGGATSQWFLRGAEMLGIDLRPSGAHTRAVIGHVVRQP